MAAPRPLSLLNRSAARSLVSYQRSSAAGLPLILRQRPSNTATGLPRASQRAYADAPPVVKIKKKGRGFFRWTWLLTKLGLLGGTVWFAYAIWDLRQPDEQFEPDPSKKTLVILGKQRLDHFDLR